MKSLQEITEFVVKAHAGQKRKYKDEPYVNHPIRVSNRLLKRSEKVVALLHDVFEDTNYNLSQVKTELQLTGEEMNVLHVLTRRKDTSYFEYIYILRSYPLAVKVKIEDLKDNLSDLPPGPQRDKYELALFILTDLTPKE